MSELEKLRAIIQRAASSVPLPGAPTQSAAHHSAQSSGTTPNNPPTDRDSRTGAHPGAPGCSTAHQQNKKYQTNPNRTEQPLTTRQLAAARWLARGMSSSDVAAKLGTIRQTINRWKKLLAFATEVRRLHEMLAVKSER